jgi:hypothetical protein
VITPLWQQTMWSLLIIRLNFLQVGFHRKWEPFLYGLKKANEQCHWLFIV